MNYKRPSVYNYFKLLTDHLGDENFPFFCDDKFVWPRQLEIHLPGNHIIPCQLACNHCQGRLFKKGLAYWEMDALKLLNLLEGAIPFQVYGGAYTEPLINPYLITFLNTTKTYGNHFGIHTNGILLKQLEETQGWLTELNRISTDRIDYLSISLDAGYAEGWCNAKNTKNEDWFYDILMGIRKASEMCRDNSHAIRICYLITEHTGSLRDIKNIVNLAKELKVDSLRFSIPYGVYTKKFDVLSSYKETVEDLQHIKYSELLKDIVSKDNSEIPYIFYVPPDTTNVENYYFDKCIYGYFQCTIGADGYLYKCSSTAAPNAITHRLGKATSNIQEFTKAVLKNYNKEWDCKTVCFNTGLRCNRQAIELNQEYYRRNKQ